MKYKKIYKWSKQKNKKLYVKWFAKKFWYYYVKYILILYVILNHTRILVNMTEFETLLQKNKKKWKHLNQFDKK